MIDKLLRDSTDSIAIQLFRYIFVGGTAFFVDIFFLYVFSDIFGIYYLISAVLSFLISVLVNYVLSKKWIFSRANLDSKVLEFNLFVLISAVGLVFTEILLYFFTDIVGLYYLVSKFIATVIVLFWNFTARRFMFYGRDFI